MNRGRRAVVLFLSVVCFLYREQEGLRAEEAAAVSPAQKSPPGASLLVSLDFKEADIQVVLQALARKAGVNIVTSKEVSGLVTIRLENVSWEQALDTIVTNYGYGFERNDNVVLVSTLEELKNRREAIKKLVETEPVVTKVLELKYLGTAETKSFLESQLSPQGRISILELPLANHPRSVVITDTRTVVDRVEEILATIDVPPPPPKIQPAEPLEVTPKDRLSLQGVVFDSKALSYAIINGKIVGQMEEVDGAQVLKIEPAAVTVLVNGQEIRLTIHPPVKENPQKP